MAFSPGVADDQPSGSARCTQTRTFMFDLDLQGVNVAVHAVTAFWADAKAPARELRHWLARMDKMASGP